MSLPCCVSWTTAAGSLVEMATGVAPTAGILISASTARTLPLASAEVADVLVAAPLVAVPGTVVLELLSVAAGVDSVKLPILLGT